MTLTHSNLKIDTSLCTLDKVLPLIFKSVAILSQKPKVFMAFGGNQIPSKFLILPPHCNGHAR